jgi:hypothetical protein
MAVSERLFEHHLNGGAAGGAGPRVNHYPKEFVL